MVQPGAVQLEVMQLEQCSWSNATGSDAQEWEQLGALQWEQCSQGGAARVMQLGAMQPGAMHL